MHAECKQHIVIIMEKEQKLSPDKYDDHINCKGNLRWMWSTHANGYNEKSWDRAMYDS